MFEIISTIFRYVFIIIIYLFIFGIIRLIYLDIRSMDDSGKKVSGKYPYLKLLNRREKLNFKVHESYILDTNKIIGRSNKSDIVIQDPFLSGKHVYIKIEDNKYLLEDLESTNGTFVNTRVGSECSQLKNGDRIHIGQLYLYL